MAKEDGNAVNKKSRSSKPYDASNSFVKQVTNRVTRILPRLGWFSPPIDFEERGIVAPARINQNDSSSEDDESSIQQFAPPAKRARSELNQPLRVENNAASTPNIPLYNRVPARDFIDGTIAGPSGISRRPGLVSSTPAMRSPQVESHFIETPESLENGDNASNSSLSTSGCSSLIPQAKYQVDNKNSTSVNNRLSQRRGFADRGDMSTFLQSSRSMLDTSLPRPPSAASSRRPSFNASVFSSPTTPSTESNLSDRVSRSPFYAGGTQYGGASSYRRPTGSLFTLHDVTTPLRQAVQVKSLNSTNEMEWGSCTARKILDTLDNLSTPVLDAKRIPSTPPLGSSRKRPARAASPAARSNGPATRDLTIPTVQDLLKLQRQSKMYDSMEAARAVAQSPALNPVARNHTDAEKAYRSRLDGYPAEPSATGKATSKMRTLEDEMRPDDVRLPIVPLPITTLPTFDFQPAAAKKPRAPKYTFARPTPLNAAEFFVAAAEPKMQSLTATKTSAAVNSRLDVQPKATGVNFSASCPSQTSSSPSKPVLREKASYMELTKSGAQNGRVGLGELKAGSVMDVLGKKDSAAAKPLGNAFGEAFRAAAGSWPCSACDVRNKSDAAACVACTTPRAAEKAAQMAPAQAAGFGAMFKAAVGTWECGVCMVRNQMEAASCVSCTTPKPGAKPAPPIGFGSAFKRPADEWKCDTCDLSNKNGAVACIACTTPKPGAAPKPSPMPSCVGFGPSKPAADGGKWECPSCMVENQEAASVCTTCEKRRPDAFPTKGFTSTAAPASGFGDAFKKAAGSWDCAECMVTNKDATARCIACETPRPGAAKSQAESTTTKFNVPIPAAASSFVFGMDKAGVAAKAATSAPSFQFGASKPSTQTTGFSFGIPPKAGAAEIKFGVTNSIPPTTTESVAKGAVSATPFGFEVAVATNPVDVAGGDRKRKGDDSDAADSLALKASAFGSLAQPGSEPVKLAAELPKNNFIFGSGGAAKTNGPVDVLSASSATTIASLPTTTSSNLFAFGSSTTAKPGSGFGSATAAKTGSGFGSSFGSTPNPFTTPASSAPAFAFGVTAPQNSTAGDQSVTNAPKKQMVSFGSAAAAPKEGGFGALTSSALNFPSMSAPSLGGGLPFGVVAPKTPTSSFPAPASQGASLFGTGASAPSSAPFVFGQTEAKPAPNPFGIAKQETFGSGMFGQNAAPAPDAKAATGFNFTAAPTVQNSTGGFGFAPAKAPMFGDQAAKAAAPAFGGGIGFERSQTSFAFSAAPQPAPAFAFGQPTAAAAPTFDPGVRPTFNFTGGNVPQFTAAGIANPSTPGPRRIIKKAVRRAPR